LPLFKDISLTDTDYFRAVVLYGRNVASYKFALAESLFKIASEDKDFVTLEQLADPFTEALCRHLQLQDKQTTSRSSKFLDTLRDFNQGLISKTKKIDVAARLGFINVIDAFHVVGSGEIPVRFFHDERNSSTPGIRLTDELFEISNTESRDLVKENESRWALVESAWAYNLPKRLAIVAPDEKLESLFYKIDGKNRRGSVTGARDALNGYQRGKCFYCKRQVHIEDWSDRKERGEVDHVFPKKLQGKRYFDFDLDQIWNLVLSCNDCNSMSNKGDKYPNEIIVEELYWRNEKLLKSMPPLRESITVRTGKTSSTRKDFLQSCYNEAHRELVHPFEAAQNL